MILGSLWSAAITQVSQLVASRLSSGVHLWIQARRSIQVQAVLRIKSSPLLHHISWYRYPMSSKGSCLYWSRGRSCGETDVVAGQVTLIALLRVTPCTKSSRCSWEVLRQRLLGRQRGIWVPEVWIHVPALKFISFNFLKHPSAWSKYSSKKHQ